MGSIPPTGSATLLDMDCLECGKETDNPKYCGLSCACTAQQRSLRESRPVKSKSCAHCGVEFQYGSGSGTRKTSRDRFCSRSCAASHNNAASPKRLREDPGVLVCANGCGRPRNKWAKTCGHRCAATSKREKKIVAWFAGDPSGVSCASGISKSAREFLLFLVDGNCQECGWGDRHPITGKCLVEVDHVDGDHTNNLLANLRVVCPNCHAKSPYHRNLNSGRGRPGRRASIP